MKLLGRLFAVTSLLLIAACGSQTNNQQPVAPTGPGIITPNQCAAGQIYTTLGCLPQDPRCQITEGFNAATNQCVPGAGTGVVTVQRMAGLLTIVDRSRYEWYLNDASASRFCENYGNVYSGISCNSFSRYDAGIQIVSQGVSGQYAVQVAPVGAYHPYGITMPALPMRLFPTNDSQGFALQQNNGFSLVQVVGRSPFGSAASIEVEVAYKNVVFARGTISVQ
ncbi:MAG: hypothetical protein K2X47_01000 [Bdellovibrionales bacterium]|nr:hypothetical protein [Bdellovibrionales bacterium]